jgi:hypothetical protein
MADSTIISFDKDIIKFILCDCNSEILVIEYDNTAEIAYLAIYESIGSYNAKTSWKSKIKYIWKILTNKYPYGDQIVLSKKKIKSLINFLESFVTK